VVAVLAELEYEYRRVKVECPACGKEQFVKLRSEGLAMKNGIMSLVIRAACDHEFHLYLDKSYQVRGYEKVDMIVASEMMQVDDAISSFMKDEGMKESKGSMKDSKVRNEFERERFLETFIKFFRGVDASDVYFSPVLYGGSRVAKEKMIPIIEPASPAQVQLASESTIDAVAQEQEIADETIPGPPASEQITDELASAARPAVDLAKESGDEAQEEASGMELPFETIKIQYENRVKKINEIMINLELQNLDNEDALGDVELVKKKAKLQKIREELEAQFNKLLQDHGVEKQDFTIEDVKAQFEGRIKKINQLMLNLELENLNETMSDIDLEKKKIKLEQIREDLKAQYNKFLDGHGIEHQDVEEEETPE